MIPKLGSPASRGYRSPTSFAQSWSRWRWGPFGFAAANGTREAAEAATCFTESHRMFGVGRDLCGSPSPTPCRSRVTYSRLHRTLSRRVLNISREGDPHSLPGQGREEGAPGASRALAAGLPAAGSSVPSSGRLSAPRKSGALPSGLPLKAWFSNGSKVIFSIGMNVFADLGSARCSSLPLLWRA